MSVKQQVVILFKYKNNTYEIYDYPIDLNRLKEFIKQKVKPANDVQLSWMRSPNTDYINIVDDSNLQRCFEKQINSQAQQNPSEYIINLKVDDVASNQQESFNMQNVTEKDLSKSAQIQYPMGQKFINNSQENQFQINNNELYAQPQVEYDRSKYTDYNCYNCGGDAIMQQPNDQKCSVCQGVGKVLKTKEIDTIEYLIEKKLCQLYPELKQIYKKLQQNSVDEAQSSPVAQYEDSQQNKEQPPPEKQNKIDLGTAEKQKNDQSSVKQEQSGEQQNNLQKNEKQEDNKLEENPLGQGKVNSEAKKIGKKSKKQKFSELFSNQNNNPFGVSITNNGLTPNGEDVEQAAEMGKSDNMNNLKISNNQQLKTSDEIFSFDVFKYPCDKNEIVFKSNEKQVLDIQLKRKCKNWPGSKIYVEEAPEKYFENLSEKKEYDFSQNEEIQTIQLILKPALNTSGEIISRWKLFYLDNNNEKKAVNGTIPFRAIIQQ